MTPQLDLHIQLQPDDTTCGPTCLHAVYRFLGDVIPLEQLVTEIPVVEGGGTLAVHLASHALRRGYVTDLYTFNLRVVDPTWFGPAAPLIAERLRDRRDTVQDPKLRDSCDAYLEYLELGGNLHLADLTPTLLARHLDAGYPVLAGLSSTYLYRSMRELGEEDDDVAGEPAGHFVVLFGHDPAARRIFVADPLGTNPLGGGLGSHGPHRYAVDIDRLVCAILLGVLTYDGNLLVVRPAPSTET